MFFQNLLEFLIDAFYNLTESISGKNAAKIFPWFMSFFLFILVANWSGLIPGVGTVGFFEKTDVHNSAASHEEEKEHSESAVHF